MYSFLCELTFAMLLIFVRFVRDNFDPFTAAGLFITVLGYHVQLTYFVLIYAKRHGNAKFLGQHGKKKVARPSEMQRKVTEQKKSTQQNKENLG